MCGVCKEFSAFYKSKDSRSGIGARCKECEKSSARARYQEYKPRRREVDRIRNATPERKLAERKRYRTRGNYHVRFYHANHKRCLVKCRIRAQRRRARLANVAVNDLTEQQWRDILEYHDYRCAYCLVQMPGELTVEHVVPISRDGDHTEWNVVPACKPCNSSKGDRSIWFM